MAPDELAHIELLAELDALVERLDRWARGAPDWQPAETCRAMIRRLDKRVAAMRVRWEAPLVVAMLGGTGTGKSALINALLGGEVVQTGRQRPTTTRPTLICRKDITPEMLGIDAAKVEVVSRDLPMLGGLALVDCPDPDTTEEAPGEVLAVNAGEMPAGTAVRPRPQQVSAQAAAAAQPQAPREGESNLARLREILPHCDVLVVTATQQKYRSARVEEELARAAAGARLVFVQTHADLEDDIRGDWRAVLADQYVSGRIFFIDSLSALADAQEGRQPRGEFALLVDLLMHELAGAAGNRIRRANFLDLAAAALAECGARLDEALPKVQEALSAIQEHRTMLASKLAQQMRGELLASRRPWENRLLGQTASRWGLSPFALVLRVYQTLGSWALGALVLRARTPAQMALWGTLEGVHAWRKRRQDAQAGRGIDRAVAGCWDEAEVRKAGLILDGYAAEAGLDRSAVSKENVAGECAEAGANFIARASADLQSLVARLAARHTGWFTRACYEILFCAMLGGLLYRLGKNFFYDSWLAAVQQPVLGLDFYLTAGFWLVLWCFLLLAAFTSRLRRGLRREIDRLAVEWQSPSTAAGLFARLEAECKRAMEFRRDLEGLDEQVNQLRRRLAMPGEKIGHRL